MFGGSPSYCFVKRLGYLKKKIKSWNKEHFKNIFSEKFRLEEEMSKLNEKIMMAGMPNEEFELEKRLKDEYMEVLRREELYWRDKLRELWIVEGDSNTKFFHASVKARISHNRIIGIQDEYGKNCSSGKEIEKAVADYFTRILGS